MLPTFLNYLIESSVCLFLFTMVYRFMISGHTHFRWMRIYLLTSLCFSVILPLITIPVNWSFSLWNAAASGEYFLLKGSNSAAVLSNVQPMKMENTHGILDLQTLLIYFLFLGYLTGLIYKAFHFMKNVRKIQKYIRQNPKTRENYYWIVDLKGDLPAFTFLNYIFLNRQYKEIDEDDFEMIKQHEMIHAAQYHSVDILLVETVSIVFWFNPIIYYLKKSLQEVHEFIADETVAGDGDQRRDYLKLLMNLVTENKSIGFSASFTGPQIKKRISMMARSRTSPLHKLLYSILLPLTVLLGLSFSVTKSSGTAEIKTSVPDSQEIHKLTIGEIIWQGNTAFGATQLNELLGLRQGDKYNHNVSSRLEKVQWLYLDSGYLFYKADFAENIIEGNKINITITIYEGIKAKFGVIAVTGNKTVSKEEIVKKTELRNGEFFSKTKIIKAINALESMGKFVPKKIGVNVIPEQQLGSDNYGRVDIEFTVIEK